MDLNISVLCGIDPSQSDACGIGRKIKRIFRVSMGSGQKLGYLEPVVLQKTKQTVVWKQEQELEDDGRVSNLKNE